ncbi:hypothetical protein [Salsuginibacillus kocurii]|nr:hypothetical protein [Salsuginibacillus kocurii]
MPEVTENDHKQPMIKVKGSDMFSRAEAKRRLEEWLQGIQDKEKTL